MTKYKKYIHMQELRAHLTNLGYPLHMVEAALEKHSWSKSFGRTATSGKSSAPRV